MPLVASARQGEKVTRLPDIELPRNSQTIALLEGYLNINPTGIGGPTTIITDGSVLEAETIGGAANFVESGKTGTGEISTYTVRNGDTLSEIAEMFGVSVNTIVWANDIKGGQIKEGQELVILPVSGVRHTVKSGETLKGLATKYKADLEDVLAYNDLSLGDKIAAGDVVIIPNGVLSGSSGSTPASGKSTAVETGYFMRPLLGGKKSQGIHGFNAVDIAAPVGTPIVASAGGKVIIAKSGGYNGGYGSYVAISHPNGTQTVYGHMSRVDVTVGSVVGKGQVIGAVGNTGHSTGPHVHFEIRGAKNPF